MMARSWRYCGSGAVMTSELVAGSAWICPPVEGWLLALVLPAPMPIAALRPAVLVLAALAVLAAGLLAAAAPPPAPLAAIAARSVVASCVASAFFK